MPSRRVRLSLDRDHVALVPVENAMYTDLKAAQIAAYFLAKAGGRLPYLKLIKLMYLGDRAAMAEHGFPISEDAPCSMPHGPVLSRTLNLINGNRDSDDWSKWIHAAENYEVSLVRDKCAREEFDELSDLDLEVLDGTWAEFGKMDKWQLRDYTHKHCPEWKDPNNSSAPINSKTIFKALGRTDAEADELFAAYRTRQQLDRKLEDIR